MKFCPSVPRSRGSTHRGGDSPQPMTIPSLLRFSSTLWFLHIRDPHLTARPCWFSPGVWGADSTLSCPSGPCAQSYLRVWRPQLPVGYHIRKAAAGCGWRKFWKPSLGKWTLPCFSSWAVHHPPEFMTPQQTWAAPHLIPNPSAQAGGHRPDPLLRGKVLGTGGYPPSSSPPCMAEEGCTP